MGGQVKVKVESVRGNLRLRWSYLGQRHCVPLGLHDSPMSRSLAQSRADLISADIEAEVKTGNPGNFDPTLKKYRRSSIEAPMTSEMTAVELFRRFTEHKRKTAKGRDMERFSAIGGHLTQYFGQRSADIDDDAAAGFQLWLAESLAPVTQKGYLILVRSCWQWGIKQNLVSGNPWEAVVKGVEIPPRQRPRPFTADEIRAIMDGFKSSRYYSYYTDFAMFLFGTGCRTGEAIGLRWGHLLDECGKVWIGESVSRGVRKSTKTNKSREFRLSEPLQIMLLNRRPKDWKPDELVFPAVKGGTIDGHNFRNRAWDAVLEASGVTYRRPYNTRHTFISHALKLKQNPMTIAQMTGHDPETLFKYYAADVSGGLQCPDIFA
jgi:integrase